MKTVSAYAAFSGEARELFADRSVARETAKKVLDTRRADTGSFEIRGKIVRTTTTVGAVRKKK